MDVAQNIAALLGWAALIAVAFVTLSPIGLRPRLGSVTAERFGAFAAVGFLLSTAYPNNVLLVSLMLVAAAVVLELCQGMIPGRHSRLADAVTKIAGSVGGEAAAVFLRWMLESTS